MGVEDNKTKSDKVTDYLQRHSIYILGVVMGLVLVFINVYIGLSLIRLVLDEQRQPAFQEGLSLPVINTDAYSKAKSVYQDRQQQNVNSESVPDPFRL